MTITTQETKQINPDNFYQNFYNSDKLKKDAILYLRGKDRMSEITESQISSLRQITKTLYNSLLSGLDVRFVDGQPYSNHEQIKEDVTQNKRLLISKDFNNSDLFGPEINLKFRAVHDFYHVLLNQPFGYVGEAVCYEFQKQYYSEDLHKILYSEIVLQAGFYDYFGNFPAQKVVY